MNWRREEEAMNEQSRIAPSGETEFTRSCGLSADPVPLEPYRSPEFFEQERDRIFRRSWLMLARIEEIAEPGQFVVKSVPTCNLSVILTHGKGGAIRAFHNSCSHRGSELVQAPRGRQTRFACPYHSWTYANDGQLLSIPDEASFFGLDKAKCGLTPIACETWEGWVFINLQKQPEVPLQEFLGPFADHLGGLLYQGADSPVVITADLDANWKVVVDAFLETYHIPVIHPKTIAATFSSTANPFARLLDARVFGPHRQVSMYGNPDFQIDPKNKVEMLAYSAAAAGSVIAAGTKDATERFLAHPAVNPTGSANWSMDVNHLFPHTQIDCGPGGFWTHQFWPTSANTCRYEVRFYVPQAANVRERLQQELYVSRVIEVVLEDLGNVARTQRGINGGGKDIMHLQDSEVGIRHHMDQVFRWVAADSVREALRGAAA